VRFALLVLDEAQKVKTPAVRMTDAAKAMSAEFKVAMTGTPVENRLADLWCIVDGIHPGRLGDLKGFSARYEREVDPAALQELKDGLERERPGPPPIPPLLLRRTREQELPDLPRLEVRRVTRAMPAAQLEAYRAAIDTARGKRDGRGWMLEALQAIRAVSLHPAPEADLADDDFIAMSGRLQLVSELLDQIAGRGEKVLLFLDSLAMQARLATLLQRRYALPAPPAVISGEVTGRLRQQRVDRFQADDDGFGCLILSPRAGGVGLTLTRATHVIHLQRWWNPAVEDQCNGRALRIGQTRTVTAHLPLLTIPGGRSFDENLDALLERKRRLMQEALVPPAASEREQAELLEQTLGG
jgi:SNF2 family DNA or RNA helicase